MSWLRPDISNFAICYKGPDQYAKYSNKIEVLPYVDHAALYECKAVELIDGCRFSDLDKVTMESRKNLAVIGYRYYWHDAKTISYVEIHSTGPICKFGRYGKYNSYGRLEFMGYWAVNSLGEFFILRFSRLV